MPALTALFLCAIVVIVRGSVNPENRRLWCFRSGRNRRHYASPKLNNNVERVVFVGLIPYEKLQSGSQGASHVLAHTLHGLMRHKQNVAATVRSIA